MEAVTQPKMMLNNEGSQFVYNRAARRKRIPKARTIVYGYIDVPENKLTKSTHKIQKLRSKNAKRINYNKRKLARAGKASQEDHS